jgi:hypothetical protein
MSIGFGSAAGAVTVKLNTETVASFGSNNLTINAVGGSADILEKGGLEDLQAQISKGGPHRYAWHIQWPSVHE